MNANERADGAGWKTRGKKREKRERERESDDIARRFTRTYANAGATRTHRAELSNVYDRVRTPRDNLQFLRSGTRERERETRIIFSGKKQ